MFIWAQFGGKIRNKGTQGREVIGHKTSADELEFTQAWAGKIQKIWF